jgi:hypothetical protein
LETHLLNEDNISHEWGLYYYNAFSDSAKRNGILVVAQNAITFDKINWIFDYKGVLAVFDIILLDKTFRFIIVYFNPSFPDK